MLARLGLIVAVTLSMLLPVAEPAAAQKQGGTLRIYHRDNPPSASVHEESTVSVIQPFMALFNNLVLFDQNKPLNSLETIVPDLASSWAWDDSKTKLTFKLREGVKWHDGKPFTAKDVQCTWHALLGKDGTEEFRRNPRKVWYYNLKEVTTNGDHEATFHLGHAQPSFLMLLASGFSPVYPCHMSQGDMRTKPVGTGPFKFAELNRNVSIKLVRNPDYWKRGRPFVDVIEMRIIDSRSTRILGFVAGEFDMTFDSDITVPLMKDMAKQAPQAICELRPSNVSTNLIVNTAAPPFDNPQIRKAMALAIDRKAFIEILTEGKASMGGAMLPAPEGQWAMPAEELVKLPGYGADAEKNRAEARKIMEGLGYGPGKTLKVKVSTRNIAIYRDPGSHSDRSAQGHSHRRCAGPDRYHGLVCQGAAQGLFRRPQPDGHCRRRSRRQPDRKLHVQFGAQLHPVLQPRDRQADIPAVQGDAIWRSASASCGRWSASSPKKWSGP